MRVGIIALLHESNTFITDTTEWEQFESDVLAEGDEVRQRFEGGFHEVSGFLAGLRECQVTAVPLFAARAVPYGPIGDATYRRLLDKLVQLISCAEHIDGWLVAVHGAAVSRSDDDVDGTLLTIVRELVGDKPMVATLDAHANLSPRMVAACDAIIAYRTNPHVDQFQRGVEAAHLLTGMLRGRLRPVLAAAFPPLVINIERQGTDDEHWQDIKAYWDGLRNRPGILTADLLLGFPYADVPKMGAAVMVTANDDEQLAYQVVCDAARYLWQERQRFVGRLVSVDDAMQRLSTLQPPVCLLDMGDNVGGGSPGDGTVLAHALLQNGVRAFVCLYDPHAVRQCSEQPIGSTVELEVGGKIDRRHGEPIRSRFCVRGIFDGRFTEDQPRHGGMTHFDQGLTVVLDHPAGLTVMVTSRRMPPFSLKQLTAFGIDPSNFRAVVAKGVHAPLAAYRHVCSSFLRVDTPGVTCANLERLTYRRRRRPAFPWEQDFHYDCRADVVMGYRCQAVKESR